MIIVVENRHQFQVATFRAEADYQDGRRPEKIVFANAEADASRRDFTVNGLFYDPITKKIHDWVGGEKDLRAKIIRTIGKPEERFGEDHLRLLRAVRFAAQLDFEIEPKTFAAIKSLAPKIKLISAERIRDELVEIIQSAAIGFGSATISVVPASVPLAGCSERDAPNCRPGQAGSSKQIPPRADWFCCATADCSNIFCRNSRRRLPASNRRIFILKERFSQSN